MHPQNEEYWGHVNPIGPRACYDEGKRVAETMCYAYMKQVRHKLSNSIVGITKNIRLYRTDLKRKSKKKICLERAHVSRLLLFFLLWLDWHQPLMIRYDWLLLPFLQAGDIYLSASFRSQLLIIFFSHLLGEFLAMVVFQFLTVSLLYKEMRISCVTSTA